MGVHGAYRTLRAFFQGLMKEEVMAPDRKNPMLKVKAPKVVLDLLERRAKRAKLSNKPKLRGFRRAFALNILRSSVDIFVLQRMMGHADSQVLRRYHAENDEDNQLAYMRGSPVDNNF